MQNWVGDSSSSDLIGMIDEKSVIFLDGHFPMVIHFCDQYHFRALLHFRCWTT